MDHFDFFQDHHIQITVVKPPWRCFDFFQDHHIQITVVKPPWTILTPFKTIWRRKSVDLCQHKEDG